MEQNSCRIPLRGAGYQGIAGYGLPLLGLALLLALYQWQALQARRACSVTVDETCYMSCAINSVDQRKLDAALVYFGVAPLPILVEWLPVLWNQPEPPRTDYWTGTRTDVSVVSRARCLTSMIVGNGLVMGVCGWLWRRRGLAWAIYGGAMLAASPAWIAHSSLATTDALAALTWLASAAVLAWCWQEMTLGRVIAAGAACGTAISAKYSGIALVAVFGVLWMIDVWCCEISTTKRVDKRWVRLVGKSMNLLVFLYVLFVVCWAWHGFAAVQMQPSVLGADSSASRWWNWLGSELPAPLAAILQQQQHNLGGHPAMLFGRVSEHGWWFYFPVVIFLKSTPAEALLWLGILLGAIAGCARNFRGLIACCKRTSVENHTECSVVAQPRDGAVLVWCLILVIGMGMLLLVRVQIGQRYALPLLPIALLLSSDWLAEIYGRSGRQSVKMSIGLVAVVLAVAQLIVGVSSAPNYLSYASPWIGGGEQAYRWMADSNVDWGQDLPALRKILDDLPIDSRVALSYFGTVAPEAYGIQADHFELGELISLAGYDYLAISVNHLYGLQATNPAIDPRFAWLLDFEPIARAGDSIMVYEVDQLSKQVMSEPASH